MASHFIPYDSRYSLCGKFDREARHSAEPTCPACQRLLAEEQRQLEDLRAMSEEEKVSR